MGERKFIVRIYESPARLVERVSTRHCLVDGLSTVSLEHFEQIFELERKLE